jgi:hypothetical protein
MEAKFRRCLIHVSPYKSEVVQLNEQKQVPPWG